MCRVMLDGDWPSTRAARAGRRTLPVALVPLVDPGPERGAVLVELALSSRPRLVAWLRPEPASQRGEREREGRGVESCAHRETLPHSTD